jgi:CRP-like cAMP-binding protein
VSSLSLMHPPGMVSNHMPRTVKRECDKSRFFDGLNESEIKAVINAGVRRRYLSRSIVVHEGLPATYFHLLVGGLARHFSITKDGRKAFLFWVSPGDIFGASALIRTPAVYVVNTEIVSDSIVCSWSRDTIRQLASQYPRLWENGLAIARDYLAWYVASHLSLICLGARKR